MKKLPLYVTGALFAALAIAARADQPTDAAGKRKETDRLLIAAQEICPVTGESLGRMGEPVRAKSGERTVFLCCKSCLGQKFDAEHWKQAQKNMAEAQGVCPVMDEELPENPASVVVEGRGVRVLQAVRQEDPEGPGEGARRRRRATEEARRGAGKVT